MDIKAIKSYIKKNSTAGARSNSYYIYPKLVKSSAAYFEFIYQGNSVDEYIIIIDFENNIETSCTCPYRKNYAGICKHVVACLNTIMENPEPKIEYVSSDFNQFDLFGDQIIQLPKKKLPKQKTDKIILENGIITPEIIEEWTPATTNNYQKRSELKITGVSKNFVTSDDSYWTTQSLIYNPKTSELNFRCNCARTNLLCEHLAILLQKIVKTFGENFFTENYIQQKTNELLTRYGFSEEDDYKSIFEFKLTPIGFIADPKVKNLALEAKDFSVFTADEAVELDLGLPYIQKKNDYGLGILFEFRMKEFIEAYVFQGKFNKSRTDFSASIAPIFMNNFEDALVIAQSDEEQNLITKSLEVHSLLKKFKYKNDPTFLKKAISANLSFLNLAKDRIFYSFDGKGSLVRKNLLPIAVAEKEVKLYFTFTENPNFYTLKAKLLIDDVKYNINASNLEISPLFIFINEEIIALKDAKFSLYLQHYLNFPELNYLKRSTPDFYEKVIQPLSKKFEIQTSVIKKSKEIADESSLKKQVYLKDVDGELIIFQLGVQYENKLVDVLSSEMMLDSENKIMTRNQSFEDNFIEEFRSLHPKFEEQDTLFFLQPDELFENYWMLHATERMKQLGIEVFGANDLKSFKFNINKPVISVKLKSDIDWFDIEINITFGTQKVNIKDLQKAFLKQSNYVTLGDGTLGILPEEWMKKFAGYFKTGEVKKTGIQMSNFQFGIIDELYEEMETKPKFLEDLYQKKMRLQTISEIENVAIPKGIKAKLRDYQHHGLNWLVFLDKNKLGGCLADDMGLGKTLQTIAFLQYLKLNKKNPQPSLIIAPTSLIFNWKNEIEKFCPTLKMLTYVGLNRHENREEFKKYDIVISTYGSLLNDIEFLKDFRFNYVILDESQAIKNPNSKRYKAVRLLNAENRIALTGTPIENNTFDLYAQLNFLNPGLLGNMTHFRNTFSNAIDKEKDVDASQVLSKLISPFMLRRTKEQVATELPEKTESIIFCEMEKEQRTVYNTFKNQYRDYLLNKIDENGAEKSQMYILEGLTKLRQICNSTALIPTEEDFGNYSVKLETLMENIKEKTGNHKILVFSQFVKMLQIVKTRLEEEKIPYEYLDGQTTDRQKRVENFQNNKDIRVFLISLKAGGTGLNLTEADYVFIIDPWWNPAVENQAIDRCYRIGQTKNVMAYRMICKDTIEEKIVSLQQKKRNVATSIISVDDEKKSFNLEEVKDLFS